MSFLPLYAQSHIGEGTNPPRFLRFARCGCSLRSVLMLLCSSSANSESSESLSPTPAPLLSDVENQVSGGGGDGDGDSELRGSKDEVELGIVEDYEVRTA